MTELIGRKRRTCKFPGCSNSYLYPIFDQSFVNKVFHRFPKNETICQKWKSICHINHTVNCRNFFVCEDHFLDSDYITASKRYLCSYSVPKSLSALQFDHNYALPNLSNVNGLLSNNFIQTQVTVKSLSGLNTSVANKNFKHDTEIFSNTDIFSDCTDVSSHLLTSRSNLSPSTSSNQINSNDYCTIPGSESEEAVTVDNGILPDHWFNKSDFSQKLKMYRVHRNLISKVSKLKQKLQDRSSYQHIIEKLYKDGKFEI